MQRAFGMNVNYRFFHAKLYAAIWKNGIDIDGWIYTQDFCGWLHKTHSYSTASALWAKGPFILHCICVAASCNTPNCSLCTHFCICSTAAKWNLLEVQCISLRCGKWLIYQKCSCVPTEHEWMFTMLLLGGSVCILLL